MAYGHAVTLAALARPITETHLVLVEKVKEMYSSEDHPDLHAMKHPAQIQLWLRTSRFKQLVSAYDLDEERVEKEIGIITDLLEAFRCAA